MSRYFSVYDTDVYIFLRVLIRHVWFLDNVLSAKAVKNFKFILYRCMTNWRLNSTETFNILYLQTGPLLRLCLDRYIEYKTFVPCACSKTQCMRQNFFVCDFVAWNFLLWICILYYFNYLNIIINIYFK